jgi:hypothetical protein
VRAVLPTDSKIYAPNPNNLGDDYQGFLCAVANGEDRAPNVEIRRRFTRLYGNWFPPFEADHHLHAHKAYYREVNDWWKIDQAKFPLENPDKQFGLHAAILRRKLRVIWLLAASDATDEATHKVYQLSTRYYRTYCLESGGGAPGEARRAALDGRMSMAGKKCRETKGLQEPEMPADDDILSSVQEPQILFDGLLRGGRDAKARRAC